MLNKLLSGMTKYLHNYTDAETDTVTDTNTWPFLDQYVTSP